MRIVSALNLIERLEEHMFLMYDTFEKKYSDDADAVKFFAGLKRDELMHRELALKQRAIAESSPTLADYQVTLNISAMTRAIEVLEKAHSTPPDTLREALGLTHLLESSAVEHYVADMLKDSIPAIDELLADYADSFNIHFAKVLDFIRTRRLAPISPEHEELIPIRVPYKSKVRLDGVLDVEGRDISFGGLFLSTSEGFAPGQSHALEIPLPGGVFKSAIIIRNIHNGSGAGVSFDNHDTEFADALHKYIDNFIESHDVPLPALAPLEPVHESTEHHIAESPDKEDVLFINNSVFAATDLTVYVDAIKREGYDVIMADNMSVAREAVIDENRHRAIIISAETSSDETFGMLPKIRRNPAYLSVPILVISTSFDRVFINQARSFGAAFARKTSLTPEQLVTFIG